MQAIFDMIVTSVCLVNRYHTYQIKPYIKKLMITLCRSRDLVITD